MYIIFKNLTNELKS